jgi:hypothetical protein
MTMFAVVEAEVVANAALYHSRYTPHFWDFLLTDSVVLESVEERVFVPA